MGEATRSLRLRLPPAARRPALWLLAGVGYLLLRELTARTVFAGAPEVAWPGLGVVFLAGLAGGPVVATAPAVAAFADWTLRGTSPTVAAALAASVYAAGLTTFAVGRATGAIGPGETVRRFVARFAAAIAAALVASACFWGVVNATGTRLSAGPVRGLGHSFVADLAVILVTAPLLLSWLQKDWRGAAKPRELAVLLVLAAGLTEAVETGALGGLGRTTPYLLVCFVFWAALRAGRRGTSTVVALVATIAVANSIRGHGPFVGANRAATMLSLGIFLIVLASVGLGFAALGAANAAARDELRESEQRYRALAENATDVVSVLSADATILYESESSLHVVGRSPQELVGTRVVEHVHPDDREACAAAFARMLETTQPISLTLRYRHSDGHWIDLESTGRNLLGDPAVGGIVVNSRDVTERRDAERRYRDLVERLPLVTYVNGMTPDEPPRFVSPQIEEMLGYPLSVWYGDARFVYGIIHPDDLPLALVEDDVEDWRRSEYRMFAADGRVVWVLDQMVTLRDDAGEPVAVLGFLVDITQQKLLEGQLRRAQRIESLGLLAGGVAHDFNNLLMAISGYTELAAAHADEPARVRDHLREVTATADRAAALTRRLLAFGRRQALDVDVVDVNALVQETEPLLTSLVGRDVELVTRLDPALGAVRADSAQLTQVLLNLAVNARDAMPAGGMLTIATANVRLDGAYGGPPAGEYVALSVSDTGHGMDAETREHLFEPFFTTKEVGEGSGLGLAMVHGIVEQSGGRIDVDSRPGAGTSFRIVLPRVERAPLPEPSSAVSASGGRETVLLVEDEEIVRRLTAEMLERLGYRVVVACSPGEALDVEPSWDLLVTDVMMPGMKGPELAARLRELRPGAAVLFISGYAGVEAPDAELLQKPFGLDELARAVRNALDAMAVASASAEPLPG